MISLIMWNEMHWFSLWGNLRQLFVLQWKYGIYYIVTIVLWSKLDEFREVSATYSWSLVKCKWVHSAASPWVHHGSFEKGHKWLRGRHRMESLAQGGSMKQAPLLMLTGFSKWFKSKHFSWFQLNFNYWPCVHSKATERDTEHLFLTRTCQMQLLWQQGHSAKWGLAHPYLLCLDSQLEIRLTVKFSTVISFFIIITIKN